MTARTGQGGCTAGTVLSLAAELGEEGRAPRATTSRVAFR